MEPTIAEPALLVLVGPSGSGKSTWAAARYRASEIVSSDALRAVVGSGEHDQDASADAFGLLEQIVTGRLKRGLTTVIDTLGFEAPARRRWRALARAAGLSAVVVRFEVPARLARQRNRDRDRTVPAGVLTKQFQRAKAVPAEIAVEGWDAVVVTDTRRPSPAVASTKAVGADRNDEGVEIQRRLHDLVRPTLRRSSRSVGSCKIALGRLRKVTCSVRHHRAVRGFCS